MNVARKTLPLAALALLAMLSGAGCKSSSQPAAGQNGQPAPNGAQPSSASQPGSAGQPGSAAQPYPAGQPGSAGPYAGAQPGSMAGNQAPAPAPQAPPPPAVVNLPAGTRLRVSLDQDLGSKISNPGDTFMATVADPVMVNGQTVIPAGARAEGTVIDAKPLGRFKGGALLEIRLERIRTNWGIYPVATSSIDRVEKGKGKRSLLFTGGGAGLGALIGGLTGGGKGALIGGLAGGGAGAAGSAFTGNKEIFLPGGTLLTFHLDRSVQITE